MPDMDYVSRSSLISNTSEFLTTFDWDFEIITVPQVFSSAADALKTLFKLRTDSIVPPDDPGNAAISILIRGFQKTQPGMTSNKGVCVFNVQDFADVALQNFINAYVKLMASPSTQRSVPVSQLYMDANLYRLDSSRNRVKAWAMRGMLPSTPNIPDDMTGSKDPIGLSVIPFTVDYYEVFTDPEGVFPGLSDVR